MAISQTQGSAVASDTPHPDASGGGGKTLGTDVFLIASFLPPGFTKPQYKVCHCNLHLHAVWQSSLHASYVCTAMLLMAK